MPLVGEERVLPGTPSLPTSVGWATHAETGPQAPPPRSVWAGAVLWQQDGRQADNLKFSGSHVTKRKKKHPKLILVCRIYPSRYKILTFQLVICIRLLVRYFTSFFPVMVMSWKSGVYFAHTVHLVLAWPNIKDFKAAVANWTAHFWGVLLQPALT